MEFTVGMIIPFFNSPKNIPTGWLLCDGKKVGHNYPIAKMGILEKGKTPDLKGKMLLGVDESNEKFKWNKDGGVVEVSLTEDQMPKHKHEFKPLRTWDVTENDTRAGKGRNSFYHHEDTNHWTEEVGGGKPHENMPPYKAVYFIIYAGLPI